MECMETVVEVAVAETGDDAVAAAAAAAVGSHPRLPGWREDRLEGCSSDSYSPQQFDVVQSQQLVKLPQLMSGRMKGPVGAVEE